MTFHFTEDYDYPITFGYVITQGAFNTFIGSNQPESARLVEEDVQFPKYLLHGDVRTALVHYLNNRRFACYVPVGQMTEGYESV
jgi:hypothetical protein